jgi:hypothetical protein
VPQLTTITCILRLLPTVALAQIPTRGNVFFGYSYGSVDFSSGGRTHLNGWNGSLEGKVLPWVGFVADLSGLYGSTNISAVPPFKVDTKVNTVVLGPRVSVAVGKFTPFAHALFGASHRHDSASGFSESDTSFAGTWGGRDRLSTDPRNRLACAGRHVANPFLQQSRRTIFACPPELSCIFEGQRRSRKRSAPRQPTLSYSASSRNPDSSAASAPVESIGAGSRPSACSWYSWLRTPPESIVR